MGRVIDTDSTGKQRNQLMRTSAELLRHLSQKEAMDDDAKDMLAQLVYCLREIDIGIDQSAKAWEKRNYWVKAEELIRKFIWVGSSADQLQAVILSADWANLPPLLVKLFPRFADIKLTKMTRSPDVWAGAYERLVNERKK